MTIFESSQLVKPRHSEWRNDEGCTVAVMLECKLTIALPYRLVLVALTYLSPPALLVIAFWTMRFG